MHFFAMQPSAHVSNLFMIVHPVAMLLQKKFFFLKKKIMHEAMQGENSQVLKMFRTKNLQVSKFILSILV